VNRNSLSRLGAALFFLGPLAGCGARAPAWPPEPAEVRLGEDACAGCRMIVSEARFAAEVRSRDGGTRYFDDLGCLLRAAAGAEPTGVFVRAYEDGESWLRGDRAFAVRAGDVASPMGFGYAAFATREAAESFAEKHPGATVASLAALLAARPAGATNTGTN
jgi:copper chaperone NosL